MNYASAYILNKLVLALEKTRSTLDLALSSREYALANNSEERNIQLLYGLSALKSIAYSNYNDTVSFGKSLLKSVTSTTNLSFPSGNQESLSVYDMLGPLDKMSNGYIFGAIYLANDQYGSSLYISLARPASDYNGDPIIISKDIDEKTAEDILLNSNEIVFPEYNPDYHIVVYKFLADVQYYDQTISNSRVFFKLYDLRQPRGYFGFNDQTLNQFITPVVIRNYEQILEIYNNQNSLVKSIISNWVGNSGWDPDFRTFWSVSEESLPEALETYIQNELGIII
jgi:hypothetical protein